MDYSKDDRNQTLDLMWNQAVRALIDRGLRGSSRDGGAIELLNFHGTITEPGRTWLQNPTRAADPVYGAAELLWYLSGSGRVDMLQCYAPSYHKFAEPDGEAYGAYGPRLGGSTAFKLEGPKTAPWMASQITAVIETLTRKPDSRQAVISMWRDTDLPHAVEGDRKDLPCTLTLQFFVRRGELHLTASMRSNDVWLGMPYDVWCFTGIQHVVAAGLKLRVGTYHHQVGSLHLYERNHDKAMSAMMLGYTGMDEPGHPQYAWPQDMTLGEHVREVLTAERHARTGTSGGELDLVQASARGSVLSDCLALATSKWVLGFARGKLSNKGLAAAYDRKYPC